MTSMGEIWGACEDEDLPAFKEAAIVRHAEQQRVRERQSWILLVRNVDLVLGNLMTNRGFDALSARKSVREYLGIKIAPWSQILSAIFWKEVGEPPIPEELRPIIHDLEERMRVWEP